MKTLLALAVIAAGVLAANSPEIASGTTFEVADDALAEQLVLTGQASEVPADASEKNDKSKKTKTVKLRLLTDCQHGRANDVVALSAVDAKEAQAGGFADADPAAVAYAMSLRD